MGSDFHFIELRVPSCRFENWDHFVRETPEYSIGLEVMDDTPGHRGHWVHFDHHAGVIREVTMSAAMQAYLAIRQGRLMEKWLCHRRPVPVYVWNADQDVCLAAFILEYHELLETLHADPLLRWIVQYNNKIDVCGGLYPVDLDELVRNHVTWVFEPYRQQRMRGKAQGDEGLVKDTIRQVCNRLEDLLRGRAGVSPITVEPEILYESPHDFVIVDEKGDPNSRLVLASRGHRNLISLICTRNTGRYTYSIIRGSPYDEDLFPVDKLIEAFQAAEDRPKTWGGSNMAAGSDSELGSSLHWTKLRDIAESVLQEAWLEKEAPLASCATGHESWWLPARSSAKSCNPRCAPAARMCSRFVPARRPAAPWSAAFPSMPSSPASPFPTADSAIWCAWPVNWSGTFQSSCAFPAPMAAGQTCWNRAHSGCSWNRTLRRTSSGCSRPSAGRMTLTYTLPKGIRSSEVGAASASAKSGDLLLSAR